MTEDAAEAVVARARALVALGGPDAGARLQEALELVLPLGERIPERARPMAARILWRGGFYEEADRLGGLAELGRACVAHDMPGGLLFQFPKVRSRVDRLELLRLHRRWGEAVERRAAQRPLERRPRGGGRDRFRIGVLSADIRQHVVGHLLHPIFAHRDPRFELYGYSASQAAPDVVQVWFAAQSAKFVILPGEDRAAAQAIADDDLDLLIDVGGPTSGNRPAILAWRPAPRQVSWLGYPHSLGLSAIDHILLEPHLAPSRELLLEAPLLLPHAWFAMSPAAFQADPAVEPSLPMRRSGRVTFATANDPYKFNPELLRAWAQVLAAVPGSRFRLIRYEASAPALRENLVRRFAEQGVSPDRLDFPDIRGGHRRLYDEVDIALDTFPMAGGMTTCEALWMGVPTVSLVGQAVFERLGGSILASAGLSDFAVDSVEAYVAAAVALAGQPDLLCELRCTLRERIRAHPLGAPEAFARDFYQVIAAALERRAQTL